MFGYISGARQHTVSGEPEREGLGGAWCLVTGCQCPTPLSLPEDMQGKKTPQLGNRLRVFVNVSLVRILEAK